MAILVFIGILTYPIFTFGCVLVQYDEPVLGFTAFVSSLIIYSKKENV